MYKKDKPKLTVVETIPITDDMDIRCVVDVLERALADAREGRILAVAVSLVGPKNRLGYYSSSSPRYHSALLASVNLMNWRVCEEFWIGDVETEEYPDPPTHPEAS